MPDPTHLYAPKDTQLPTRVCEKCRGKYLLDQYNHGIEHLEAVCRRCVRVMGYKV